MNMRRVLGIVLLATLAFTSAAYGAVASPAIEAFDQFTVSGIKVDATAQSPRAARDLAMAQGRPLAWSKLFRRFTVQRAWGKEPKLAERQLIGLILSVEASNEQRSTTRYLADVIFHFNPAAVRQLLRRSNIVFTGALPKPALVIPLTAGETGFDPTSPWSIAWANPSLQQSLVLVVLKGDIADLPMPQDLTELDWAALAPMARRYNARQVIIAIASEDAKTVQVIAFSATGQSESSLVFARSTFAANAKAIAEKAASEWTRSVDHKSLANERQPRSVVVNEDARTHLAVNVRFETLKDWATLRGRLGAAKAVADMEVVDVAPREAQIYLSYSGQVEQLQDALAQQALELSSSGGQYTLELGTGAAANSP